MSRTDWSKLFWLISCSNVARGLTSKIKMFSIRNLRSRHKFKPPRVLTCSLLCLLTLSTILLIAQLRATELNAPKQAPDIKQQQIDLTSIFKKEQQPVRIETNAIESSRNWPQVDSIDRDDRGDLVASPTPQTRASDINFQDQLTTSPSADASLVAHESQAAATVASPVFVDDATSNQVAVDDAAAALAAQTALPSMNSSELLSQAVGSQASPAVSEDRMMQQAAAELIANFGQQPDQLYGGPVQAHPVQPSLAELAAAGTAAGLFMHDLMAQANMVEQMPYGRQTESSNQDSDRGEADDQSEPENMNNSDEQVLSQRQDRQSQPASDEDEDDEDNVDQQQDVRRPMTMAREDLMQANRMLQTGAPLQAYQTAKQEATLDTEAQPEPPDESQTPDSIESLMGADLGSELDEPEDGSTGRQSGEQSSVDEPDGQQQQQPADSNNLQRRHYGMPEQSMSAPAFKAQPIMIGNGLRPGRPEHEQNLVAPMRDSLSDLNAAAGHYYGKKKKKKKVVKKKKIIVKKKKKIKYKKYKVIKIKKKKKKKKKSHKKHHHHPHKKHHHGGGHGKYYMYAKVPKKKSWEFGFKKGNKKHWISRHEKGHKNKFKTKVMWYDKKSKGKGLHIWDYNHHDKKKKKHY